MRRIDCSSTTTFISRVFESRDPPEALSTCPPSKMLFAKLLVLPQLACPGSCLSTQSHHFSNPTDPIPVAALDDRSATSSTCVRAKATPNLVTNTMGLAHQVLVSGFESSFRFLFTSITDVSCLHDAWARPTVFVVLVRCVPCLIWRCLIWGCS